MSGVGGPATDTASPADPSPLPISDGRSVAPLGSGLGNASEGGRGAISQVRPSTCHEVAFSRLSALNSGRAGPIRGCAVHGGPPREDVQVLEDLLDPRNRRSTIGSALALLSIVGLAAAYLVVSMTAAAPIPMTAAQPEQPNVYEQARAEQGVGTETRDGVATQ